MKMAHFFIARPRFAAVLSILLVITGMVAYFGLPVAQYPEIAPPTVQVRAVYPGATPETIADTVATPLEQEINGVEGMLYMTSSSTADGGMVLTITFETGTDLDAAQVLVQNRVAVALPRLPEEVRRLGVTTAKSSPDLMMVVHLESPDNRFDQLYISNYALLRIRDVLARIQGVGNITVFGAREYSMRVWLDPERLAALSLTAGDVVGALQAQNVQVSGGALGAPPMPLPNDFQLSVNAQGRFTEPGEFEQVIVKTGEDGRLTRVGDIGRVELGARDYITNSYLDGNPAVAIAIFQRPGSNALETAEQILDQVAGLSEAFPEGLAYRVVYNPTEFVAQSVRAVYITIFEAVVLVSLVILVFLQSWRAALIPIIAIPVSLIGTFLFMAAFGFSLNNLSLFGLVLAIGIVVDDAIVVVGTALIAMALVLAAVFVPTAFLGGISGQFFRQFAMTIAVATLISAFNSLTLSPALCAILLKPRSEDAEQKAAAGGFFAAFNRGFDRMSKGYGRRVCAVTRRPVMATAVFLALLAATVLVLLKVPGGFIPDQDQGYLIVALELPKGASLQRTDAVIQEATDIILDTPGAARAVAFAGFSGATFSNASNAGAIFVPLKPFAERGPDDSINAVLARLSQRLSVIREAQIFVVTPPPVRGMGNAGGFKMMVQDRAGRGLQALEGATWGIAMPANQAPETTRVFTTFSTATPRYFLDIDRTKAEMLKVPVESIFEALSVYLGSAYANDFNLFGRSYRVTAQADAPYRFEPADIAALRVRSDTGAMVPLGSLARVENAAGPDRVVRHNLYPATELQGSTSAGHSSGEALDRMEQLAATQLPSGFGFEWTELAYQERAAGNVGLLLFPLSVLFVFLLLAAQYESWTLPLAIILIVPLCILFALLGVWMRGLDNNILTQIGMVVLIGLAAKNAILIVEFARQLETRGETIYEAATRAAMLRLRPILMTSFAFILGVVPLVIASGAGAEMRRVLGTAVFSGMIGVTLVGLFLTPVFYTMLRHLVTGKPVDEPTSESTEGA